MEMALTFNEVTLTPIHYQNGIWIRSTELAKALGYSEERSVSKVYQRNADEFSPEMTQVIEIPEGVNLTTPIKCRIFSPRGCHLLSMFARTPIAKQFRKWVLDVLDRIAKEEAAQDISYPDNSLTPDQQCTLRAIVKSKVEAIPEAERFKGIYPQIWSRFNNHFRIAKYCQLPQSRLSEAIDYLVRMEIREPKELPQQQALPPSGDKYEAYILEVEDARGRIHEEISTLMDKGIKLVDYRKFGPGCLSPYTYALADWLRDALTRPSPVVDGWRKADNALNYSPLGIFQKMEKDFEYLKGK